MDITVAQTNSLPSVGFWHQLSNSNVEFFSLPVEKNYMHILTEETHGGLNPSCPLGW
jgi:hypothetical protein